MIITVRDYLYRSVSKLIAGESIVTRVRFARKKTRVADTGNNVSLNVSLYVPYESNEIKCPSLVRRALNRCGSRAPKTFRPS